MNVFFGADYYPEHWPRGRWATDIKLMKKMGLDVVRMAEFSWSKLEPAQGEYNFGWLDEIINMLADNGIKVVLGTPSAAPPAWIIQETPAIQPVDWQGRVRHFGGRHHDCQSNKEYRGHIQRYVTAFAQHFASNENVIGWQVDNELGNSHQDLCMCDSCTASFQNWLQQKYNSIAVLNEKWGTTFWSQGYQSFAQIQAPKITVVGYNPSALLDWKLFCSDLIVDFHKMQADILRKAAPDKFITHNLMGFADKVNYFDLAKDLDFASHDQYPGLFRRPGEDGPTQIPAHTLAAALDLMRATKNKPFWIMEQQAGITGWEVMGRQPRPGQLAMWAAQSVAHGADTIVFFRWRTCAMGTEQYWHGILPHSGIPGRHYNELQAFIQKFKPLMRQMQGAMPQPKVAIVFSYKQEYALQIQPHHPKLEYVQHLLCYYQAFYNKNIPVDFVSEQADLQQYDLVIAPLQYLVNEQLEHKYQAYVKAGGCLVLTMRTGVKDDTNLCQTEKPLPGNLGELLGLAVPEYDCLRDTDVTISLAGEVYTGQKWCDIISPTTAQTVAAYASEFYAGTPAVTCNAYGQGTAYYVGTEPDAALVARLVDEWQSVLALAPLASTVPGVEICSRTKANTEYIFVINHNKQATPVALAPNWEPYFQGQTNVVPPYGVYVYTVAK